MVLLKIIEIVSLSGRWINLIASEITKIRQSDDTSCTVLYVQNPVPGSYLTLVLIRLSEQSLSSRWSAGVRFAFRFRCPYAFLHSVSDLSRLFSDFAALTWPIRRFSLFF